MDCHDEYDDGYCHCNGHSNYHGYSNNCTDCGKWIADQYTKCYSCNQATRSPQPSPSKVIVDDGKWAKYDGKWCIQTRVGHAGDKIKVSKRNGSSETKTLGTYLTQNNWGKIYTVG